MKHPETFGQNWSKQKDARGRIKRPTGNRTKTLPNVTAEEERRLNDARMEQRFGSSPIGMAPPIDIEGSVTRQP